jgi:circadian clock protein KaiC
MGVGLKLPPVPVASQSPDGFLKGDDMKPVRRRPVHVSAKAPTGVTGLDEITGGGLPRGRTTLLMGGPGSGKTILALQFLVHGARACKEPGIFIAFEESAKRIAANFESFGWNLVNYNRKGCSSSTLGHHLN